MPADAEVRAAEAAALQEGSAGLAHELTKRDNVLGIIRMASKPHLESTYQAICLREL
jgi:hypothetical protein